MPFYGTWTARASISDASKRFQIHVTAGQSRGGRPPGLRGRIRQHPGSCRCFADCRIDTRMGPCASPGVELVRHRATATGDSRARSPTRRAPRTREFRLRDLGLNQNPEESLSRLEATPWLLCLGVLAAGRLALRLTDKAVVQTRSPRNVVVAFLGVRIVVDNGVLLLQRLDPCLVRTGGILTHGEPAVTVLGLELPTATCRHFARYAEGVRDVRGSSTTSSMSP